MLHFFTKAWRSSTKNTDGERASYERENSVKASSRRVGEGITQKVQHKTPLKGHGHQYHDCVAIFENAKEHSLWLSF